MTAVQVRGKGNAGVRAGAHALSLLSVPLNVDLLQALGEEPRSLTGLRRAAGSPPETTMRGHLRRLSELDVVERRRSKQFPCSVEYELTGGGRSLLGLASVVQSWLDARPQQSVTLGTVASKSAIKALLEGWSSTLLRALAARPLALTELDRLILPISYPSLERRVAAMRMAGQIAPCRGSSRSTPYTATTWLRQAVGPLTAAMQWERQFMHPDVTSALARIDVEAAFLLAVPMIELAADLTGVCRFAVGVSGREQGDPVGVQVGISGGRVESCVAHLGGEAMAWAYGSPSAWLHAAIAGDLKCLEIGGDCALAEALLDGLHGALFAETAQYPR